MQLIKRIWLYIFLVLIILAIGYGFIPKPVSVETAVVKRGPMRVVIKEEGKTRVINRFIVSAPVAGYALRIGLDVGDAVKKGQTVTELEPLRSVALDPRSRAEAKASVSAAEAALNSAKENMIAARAAAEFSEKELKRISQLHREGLVTQGRLDGAETEARRADAQLRSSEFGVEVARYKMEAAQTALKYSAAVADGQNAEKVVIKSPVNGRVLKINQKSEGVVREGMALIEVGDPGALEIEVDVLSADAVRIRPGTPVIFERWGGEGSLKGKVRIVEPTGFTKISALGVEEQRVLVISDIISPTGQWSQLGDAYRVEASFILWEDNDVLQIPSSALFRYKEGWAVFVVMDKKTELRKVQIGYRNGLSAEIVSNVSEGNIVVTHPDSSIEDGTHIMLQQ